MASTTITMPGKTIKGFAGKEYPIPMYLQFVPGVVVEVVHSQEDSRYGGPNTINTIIAKPHIIEKTLKRRVTLGEKERYYPLFRLHSDIPSKGDPVLLCTIGKINYYLGPINSFTNNPTWNDDPSYVSEIAFEQSNKALGTDERGLRGETQNFNKENLYPRLTKKRKNGLDYGKALRGTTGDTIFEGRHGNSIRIGSRSNNPYVFISNKRNPLNNVESILDGSLISITSNGSITNHLGNTSGYGNNVRFTLSSDTLGQPNRRMGDLISNVNNNQDSNELIYNYGTEEVGAVSLTEASYEGQNANQILITSDRITIDSKLDDIYLSSKKDIHIGTGRYLTFTTIGGPDANNTDSVIFNSSNFNIGNPNTANMQSMVLGDELKNILVEIVNLLGRLQTTTSLGLQTPITVGSFAGDIKAGEPLATVITNLETKIENMLSTKHKIEQG